MVDCPLVRASLGMRFSNVAMGLLASRGILQRKVGVEGSGPLLGRVAGGSWCPPPRAKSRLGHLSPRRRWRCTFLCRLAWELSTGHSLSASAEPTCLRAWRGEKGSSALPPVRWSSMIPSSLGMLLFWRYSAIAPF